MKKSLFIALLLAFGSLIFAQTTIQNYSWNYSAGSYTEITGGTILGNASTNDERFVNPAVPLGGSILTGPGFPIGFNFRFAGASFDRFAVNANGWISLGQSVLSQPVNIASTSAYLPISSEIEISPSQLVSRISALGLDLQAQNDAELSFKTLGAEPNRELVVQWKNYRRSGIVGESFNFQIRLQESTNKVIASYGLMTAASSNSSAQVGLRGSPVDPCVDNWNNLRDSWAPPLAGNTANSTINLSDTSYPPNGTSYTWTPPLTVVPPNPALVFSPPNGNTNTHPGESLVWSDGGGEPDGYRVYFGTVNPPTEMVFISNSIPIATYDPGLLAYSTTYYWRVIPYNVHGDAADCPVWSFTTIENPYRPLPYLQDFNDAAGLWDISWMGSMSVMPNHGTNGSKGLSFNNWSSAQFGWAKSAQIGPITNNVKLSFDYRIVQFSNYPSIATYLGQNDFVKVGVSITGEGYFWFHTISNYNHVRSTNFATVTLNLPAWTIGSPIYLSFESWMESYDDYFVDIDNVYLRVSPSISPLEKDFGQVLMETAVSHEFTITNVGAEHLNVTGVSITSGAADFSISVPVPPSGSSLARGESTTFTVQYSPTAVALRTGVVTINYNDGHPGAVSATLRGTASPPTITDFPYSVDFSSWPAWGWTQLISPYPNPTPTGGQWVQDNWRNITSPVNKAARITLSGNNRNGWLVTAPINLNVDGARLSFDAALTAFSGTNAPATYGPDDRLLVVMSDNANMLNPTLLREWNNTGSDWVFNEIPHTGAKYSIVLTGITGTKYFAFYGESTVDNTINKLMIDNVLIELPDYPQDVPVTIGAGEDAITITVSQGSANNAVGVELPPLSNSSFVAQESVIFDFLGEGPWTVSFETSAPWGAWYRNGTWTSVESQSGFIVFDVEPEQNLKMPVVLGNMDPTLPVELQSFVAQAFHGNGVMLHWLTQSETNVSGYRIYRGDSDQFAQAILLNVFIEASNTSQTQSYVYYDRELHTNGTYYYWLESVDFDGSNQLFGPIPAHYEGFEPHAPSIPVHTTIAKNYPNPFNPSTMIVYGMEKDGLVSIEVYNTRGQKVRNLLHADRKSGWHQVEWDGKNDQGRQMGSGVYIFLMHADGKIVRHQTVMTK